MVVVGGELNGGVGRGGLNGGSGGEAEWWWLCGAEWWSIGERSH